MPPALVKVSSCNGSDNQSLPKESNTTLQSSEPLKELPQAVPRSCSKDNNRIVITSWNPSLSKNRLSSNSKINTFDGSVSSSHTFMDTRQLTSSPSQSFAPKALAELSSCNETGEQTVRTSLKVSQSEPSSIHGASNNLSESSSSRSMPETLPTAFQANVILQPPVVDPRHHAAALYESWLKRITGCQPSSTKTSKN